MIQKRAGKIINICSLMSDVGRITTGPYTASKGGLKMLTKDKWFMWMGE
jgi:gluconate 5-dehydrogenase